MNKLKLQVVVLLFVYLFSYKVSAQTNSLKFKPQSVDEIVGEFMAMSGFENFSFSLKTHSVFYVDVYIDEYLNDSLISQYDFFATKAEMPKDLYPMIFSKTAAGKEFPIKIYSLSKSDSIEQVQIRIGGLGLYKKISANKKDFNYEWKIAGNLEETVAHVKDNDKFPLLYFTTGIEENISGQTISRFCNVPNILNRKSVINEKGKITHYFIIGIKLTDKLD